MKVFVRIVLGVAIFALLFLWVGLFPAGLILLAGPYGTIPAIIGIVMLVIFWSPFFLVVSYGLGSSVLRE